MSVIYINPFSFYDTDAQVYISAVEAADGQGLEDGVKNAINSFVIGCKADGIWTAIKASCILAGARTLAGALVPLVGTAPTNNGPFVSGDYNRKTGLVGDGSTKYLDSNRNNNADPQDSFHLSAYISTAGIGFLQAAGASTGRSGLSIAAIRLRNNSPDQAGGTANSGTFTGGSRSSSIAITRRVNNSTVSLTRTSETPLAGNIFVLANNNAGTPETFGVSRLSFYSIGESLDLALLDTRVTALINAFAAAIP